jgi:EAL domain-containing protein (putative c-di-GMP-specific phosphodiesterase class I)
MSMEWTTEPPLRVEELVGEDAAYAADVVGTTIEVVYQPQVHPLTGATIGAEALVRARRPDGSYANNAVWLPVLEQMGQTGPIDRHVAHIALGVLARLRPVQPRMTMSLNLSPARSNIRYAATLIELLTYYGLPGENVTVEITETAAVDSMQLLAATTDALKEAGVRVSLDDFGTGWSSLLLVQRLSLDELKMDRSLINDLRDGLRTARAVARGVLSIAEELQLEVVAEGLENQQHAVACSTWDFHRYQGWGFGRPSTPGNLHARLVDASPLIPARASQARHDSIAQSLTATGDDIEAMVTPKIGVPHVS